MTAIKLVDARRGLNIKCRELFKDEKIAESIYRYLCDGIEECDNVEPELKVGEWIPVTERLPKDGSDVIITWVNHSPSIYYQHIKDKPQTAPGVYYRGKWYWWSNVVQDCLAEYGKWEFDEMDDAIEVTHWMPLPEPPKEETK